MLTFVRCLYWNGETASVTYIKSSLLTGTCPLLLDVLLLFWTISLDQWQNPRSAMAVVGSSHYVCVWIWVIYGAVYKCHHSYRPEAQHKSRKPWIVCCVVKLCKLLCRGAHDTIQRPPLVKCCMLREIYIEANFWYLLFDRNYIA